VIYSQGRNVPQDDVKAAEWYANAAARGVPQAQLSLGVMYANGQGAPQDHAKAFELCTKAAEQDLPTAQYYLGELYADGKGIPQDDAQAHEWFSKAVDGFSEEAENGKFSAQYNLGEAYTKGHGVPQDYVQAYKWMSIAAAQNNQTAIKARDLLAESMTPEQISEAMRLAQEWKTKTISLPLCKLTPCGTWLTENAPVKTLSDNV
jgi:TPR repeat protein